MTQLENNLSRVRKLNEMINELGDAITTLKGERDALADVVMSALLNDKSVFNVYKHKNLSAGLIGRNYFAVAFSSALVRKGDKRMDDQSWLLDFFTERGGFDGAPYIREKRELNKQKITADYRSGEINDDFLTVYGLDWKRTANLSVLKVRTDAELSDLIKAAQAAADVVE